LGLSLGTCNFAHYTVCSISPVSPLISPREINIFKYEKRAKNILEEAEKHHHEYNTHKLYKKINTLKGGFKKYEKLVNYEKLTYNSEPICPDFFS
jgi:hypothetical protein